MTNTPSAARTAPGYAGNMERSSSDTTAGSRHSDPADLGLDEALAMAEAIASDFTQAQQSHLLSPEVTVSLGVSWNDRTLFVFSLAIDIDDGFDPADFPTEVVQGLKATLRKQINQSDLAFHETLVSVESKVGATGP